MNDDGMTGTPHRSCKPASPTTGNNPPAPSPASNYSQGGSRVLPSNDDMEDCTNTQDTQDDDDDDETA
jgi:hypothetical protein